MDYYDMHNKPYTKYTKSGCGNTEELYDEDKDTTLQEIMTSPFI